MGVADEESQAYINHQESREGNDVTGSYNYVNPAGALVTVNYEAGVDGFSQTRDVEQGAVQMRNIPGAWTGPLAGLEEPTSVPATTSSISSRSSSQVSQEALIAQILSSIQPKISSAVQGALSSQTAGRRTVAVAAPRQQPGVPGGSDRPDPLLHPAPDQLCRSGHALLPDRLLPGLVPEWSHLLRAEWRRPPRREATSAMCSATGRRVWSSRRPSSSLSSEVLKPFEAEHD